MSEIHQFSWLGSNDMFLDTPSVQNCGGIVIGRYGGRIAAGAKKNEDAALVWCDAIKNNWEFAALLDAHHTSESASLVLGTLNLAYQDIISILNQPMAISEMQTYVISLFMNRSFRDKARNIQGETALLVCVRKGEFLWWFCVGDCVVYSLHPELAKLGQYSLNQRSFYEWVGRVNTFELSVPCFSSGVRELRHGRNVIVMITDGLLECGSRLFDDGAYFYNHFTQDISLELCVKMALHHVHETYGRDSASVLAWQVNNTENVCYPSS